MSIVTEYNKQLVLNGFIKDAQQSEIVQQLALLQNQLERHHHRRQSLSQRLKSLFNKQVSPQGCYIWGDVGRGKTWLMDMFFETFAKNTFIAEHKVRLHFHHFMQLIHDQLSLIGEHKNPLRHIARAFAKRYQLLCLDEFHVSDITDAMLLYGLLENLFAEGVVLVSTSNLPPHELYKNGLQRERFLPAIALIQSNCITLNLNGPADHRLRLLEKADTWYLISEVSQKNLESRFLELISSPAQRQHNIHLNYRRIQTILYANDIIWLDFMVICGNQRGSADYIEIARQFHTVFISDIPVLDNSNNDKAKRFVNMIDEFYDRNVNLLCSAETKPDGLYTGTQLKFEFKRTISRLQEMRSHDYMQRPHKSG